MVKQVVFLVMAAMAMEACSTEQNVMEQVRMSDVVNSGCTSSFSATESRPEYYKAEKEKSAKMLVSVDAKGIAHFQVTDLQANCAVNGFNPQVHAQDGEIRIVLIPLGDSTIEADCMCNYNVSFNLSNLFSGTYHVMVYRSDFSGKYGPVHYVCQLGQHGVIQRRSIATQGLDWGRHRFPSRGQCCHRSCDIDKVHAHNYCRQNFFCPFFAFFPQQ